MKEPVERDTKIAPQQENIANKMDRPVERDIAINATAVVQPHWGRRVSSIIIGGGIAVFAAPVIYAGAVLAMPVVAATCATAVAAGVIGGVSTQGVAEIIDAAPSVKVQYNANEVQKKFKQAMIKYFDYLESAILAIRTNTDYEDKRTLHIDDSTVAHLITGTAASDFCVHVVSTVRVYKCNNGRTIENSVAAPHIPVYAEDVVGEYTVPSVTSGLGARIAWSAVYGLGVGTIGAACAPLLTGFVFVPTVVTSTMRVGVLVGLPTVSGAGSAIMNMAIGGGHTLDVTGAILLCAEISKRVERIVQCAILNGGKLEINMKVLIGKKISASATNMKVENVVGIALDVNPKVGID